MKRTIAVTILSTFCLNVLAGTNLNYMDCERILLNKNKDIKIAKHALNQSEIDKRDSFSGFLPSLSFSTTYRDKENNNLSPSKKSYLNSLTLSQNIFNGFKDISLVESANLNLEKKQNELSNEERKQVSELKIAFTNLATAKRMYDFSVKAIKTRQNIKDLVSLKFSSGSETKDSMLFAEGQLEEAKLDSLNAKHSIETAKRSLKNILGDEINDDFDISGNVPSISIPENPNFEDYSLRTSELKNVNLDLKISDADIKYEKGNFLPTVSLSLSRDRENIRAFGDSNYTKDYYTIVELSVNIPLFDSFTSYNSYHKILLEKEKTKLTYEKTKEAMISELKNIHEKAIELNKKKEIYQKYLSAAKLREEINTSKYRLGLIRFDTWIDSQNDLINYEKDVIDIDLDIESNLSKWESLVNS